MTNMQNELLSAGTMMTWLRGWKRRPAVHNLVWLALIGLAAALVSVPASAVDLLVSNFTDAPDPAIRGGVFVYSASITNNTPDTANNVSLVFVLDAQTSFVAVSDGAHCSYAGGSHSVTCHFASLAGDIAGPGSAQVFDVDVTVRSLAGAGNIVNATATVSSTDTDTNGGNNTLSQITTIDNGADLALSLTPNVATVPASGSVTYTAAIVNNGPNVADAVAVAVTLSPNITYQSASGSGWNCAAAGHVVTCTHPGAPLGALSDITITGSVTGAITGTITSTGVVTIGSAATDFNPVNNASTANVTVTTGTDLGISKTASSLLPAGGAPMTFTLAARNLGPFSADNVSVTDTLPAGFTAISAAGTGWTCGVSGQVVTCTRLTYAVGAANDITVTATPPVVLSPTSLTNNTAVSSSTPDGVSANNSASVTINVLPDGVDLSISKTKTPNPVAQGGSIASALRVTNNGPRAARSGEVSISETLPVGEVYVGITSGANWTCGAQVGQIVTCTYNTSLAVGNAAADLILNTTASAAGTLTNAACAIYTDSVGAMSDPVPANNCASASVFSTVGSGVIDLQLTKTADVAVLAWNAPTVTYTLTVTNAGPGAADGIVLFDPIPGYVAGSTVIAASRTGGTSSAVFSCVTGAAVTCTQTSGNMVSGSTAIFSVAVTRPLFDSTGQIGGTWKNTASVRSDNEGDSNPANNSASAFVQVDPVADVTVLTSVTPGSVQAGTNATFVLTANNNGPSTANGVALNQVFTIPSGSMTFISATPSSGTCLPYNTGTKTLSCNVGSLTSGGTATVTVVVRPDYQALPPNPRTITSDTTVTTTTDESNLANNAAQSVLTVTPASLDLLINNTDSPDPLGFVPASAGPVFPDNVVTYRNQVTNRGPSVASGLVLTYAMTPPPGKSMTFLGDKLAAGGQSYSNYCNNLNAQVTGPATQTITCIFPPGQILLSGNATTDLYLDFHVDSAPASTGDAYLSIVTIAANEPETVLSNNTVSQTTTIRQRVDLQLTKSARAYNGAADAAATIVQTRQPFYWVLTVTNAGPGDSAITTVTDTLPSGISLYAGGTIAPYNAAPYNAGVAWRNNNGTPGNGTCSGAATITCNLGLLEAGKVATILVPVVSNSAGARNNCASSNTSEVDPNSANNTNICSNVTVQASSLSGTVYADLNNDGLKAGGEPGIAAVTVILNGSDIYGNSISNITASTDGSGNFSFVNLSPGTYALTETQPAAYLDGLDAAGSQGGAVAPLLGDAISAINLPANTAATNYLFGEVTPASLSGFVFVDLNVNAQRDLTGTPGTDEAAGLTGVTLTLSGTSDAGAVNQTTTSAANGAYSFSNLRPGTYQVVQSVLTGLTHTGMTIGSKGGNDGASVLAAATPVVGAAKRTVSNIALLAGDAASNYNFGESGQGLSGIVYVDLNNNGVKDAGELGIAGVSVTLSGTTAGNVDVCVAISPSPCTVTTDSNGVYQFYSLPASNGTGYVVTEQAQASAPLNNYNDGIDTIGTVNGVPTGSVTNDRFAGIVIATGQVGSNYNFGEFGEITGSISGFVYLDANHNGIKDVGETGIAGVVVTLTGTAASGGAPCYNQPCQAITAVDGSYTVSGVKTPNGTGYTLTETQPADYQDGSNNKGTLNGALCVACVDSAINQISAIPFVVGQPALIFNFGEILPGSIAGRVYHDANNNLTLDAGEALAGVTLTLSGIDDRGASVNASTTTAVDGSYRFTGLRPSNGAGYSVTETQPGGLGDYAAASGTQVGTIAGPQVGTAALNLISGIVLPVAGAGLEYNFRENASSLSGSVYLDSNRNGIRDAGERGIAGIAVSLSGSASRNTVTDAQGNFSFIGLAAGTYSVTEAQPAGYVDGVDASGSAGGVINAPKNRIGSISLPLASNGVTYLFGEQPVSQSSLTGTVYADNNGNASVDAGDVLLANVSVRLSGADYTGQPVNLTATTNASGVYQFPQVPPGSYTLTETQPAGYDDFPLASGTKPGVQAGGSAAKNSVTGLSFPLTGVDATAYDFRERTPTPSVALSSIAGIVYVDANGNGIRDVDEPLLPNVSLTLRGVDINQVAVTRSTVTGADGAYRFIGLTAGSYSVNETQPVGYGDFATNSGSKVGSAGGVLAAAANLINTIALGESVAATGYDFRENTASLAGFVYRDDNNNGIKDGGEAPIANVTVRLSGIDANAANVSLATTTAADGSFSFTGLLAGNYTLTETQPTAWVDGKESAGTIAGQVVGSVDNSGFDSSTARNQIAQIQLGGGQSGINYLFGERGGSLQGFVYVDANNNGVKDSGEAGIAAVTVTLSGATLDGQDICTLRAAAGLTCSIKTDAAGAYSFDGLPPGHYQLVETQTDIDGGKYGDGKESAGVAGGSVNNANFGSAAYQNTIANIDLSAAVLVANQGQVGGYLFGEVPRSGPTLKPPIVSGYVYFDRNHSRVRPSDTSIDGVSGWTANLTQNGKQICVTTTGTNGFYQFDNLHCPGYEVSGLPIGSGFAIAFTKDGNRLPNVASSGGNAGTVTGGVINNITLHAGEDISEQNLPLDPSGVVYDAITRQPVAGAVVSFSGPPGFNPATHLLGGVAALTQTTGSDGLYQFFLQNDFPSGVYTLKVTDVPAGYLLDPSTRIPACISNGLAVGATPAPALVQESNTAPGTAVTLHQPAACIGIVAGGAASTQYYFQFNITQGISAPVLNNHIPLDPTQPAGLSLSKTGDKQQAEIGDTVRYTIIVRQTTGSAVKQVTVRDTIPAGFKLVRGSVTLNGAAAADPQGGLGPVLGFNLGPLAAGQQATITYRLRVGAGAQQGDGVNRALAYACATSAGCLGANLQPAAGARASNQGQHKVVLTGGVFTTDACVAGKVFVDCNHNHVQDAEELGVPGVRLYLEDGAYFITDVEGKYSYCGLSPKSHVIKVDPSTLPRGSHLTTTSNRNLGDANSLFLDVKNGELIRADFAEGSCSNPVLEQVKARRNQGEVRSLEVETSAETGKGRAGLKFGSKPARAPRQATDSANQELVQPRAVITPAPAATESNHAN
jgi:uncharacterized repeat protein (TIGR01451 family)